MADEENNVPVAEQAPEEAMPSSSELDDAKAALRQRYDNRLSVVGQQYDIDGDGVLDTIEMKMREMDAEGKGHLSNAAVYLMLKDQTETHKKLFNMRRIVIVLSCLVVILAVSNLGTAWAAAILAKDTDVDSKGALKVKGTDDEVSTVNTPMIVAVRTEPSRRRELEKSDAHGRVLATEFTYEYDNGFTRFLVRQMSRKAEQGKIIHLQFPRVCDHKQPVLQQIYDGTGVDYDLSSNGGLDSDGVQRHLWAYGANTWLYQTKPHIKEHIWVNFTCPDGGSSFDQYCDMSTNIGWDACETLYGGGGLERF